MSRVRRFVLGGVCVAMLAGGSGGALTPLSVAADSTPSVSSVSPSDGPTAGGTSIVIDGSAFTAATDVLIGTSDVAVCPATPICFNVMDDTEIDLTTPSNGSGTSDVQVVAPGGTSPTNAPADYFTYLDQPTVTNVASPASEGATGITVSGTGFAIPGPPATSAVTAVDLIPAFSGPTVALTTQCTATGQADCFDFTDDNHMPIDLPASIRPGQYDTVVVTPGGSSMTSSNDQLVVQQPDPTVTSVTPDTGPVSGGPPAVTIAGTNFSGTGFTTSGVSFGGNAATAFSVTDATTITATPPAGSGQVDVTVTTQSSDGTSTLTSATTNADTYAYAATPSVTNVSPGTGPTGGGNTVTLTGTGFKSSFGPGANFSATDVTVDATDITTTPCSGSPSSPCFTVTSATQITVEDFPPHAAGTVDITVTTPGGTSSTGPGDEYVYAVLPTVTGVAPAAGPPAGGNTVVVTGTGFTGASAVSIDTHTVSVVPCPASPSAPCFTVNSATQITVQDFPAHAPATVDITVTTPAGTSATSAADQYVYASAPTVTSVSPTFGPLGGGGSVIVNGTGFDPAGVPATGVSVGSSNVSPCPASPCFTVGSDSQLTIASFPPGSAATVHITVTSVGGTSATSSADDYTYVSPPSVTGVAPSTGPTGGGNSVTLTGTTFESAGQYTTTSVLVGTHTITATPCPGTPTVPCFTVNSSTSITIGDIPSHAVGTVDITVTTNEGTSAISSADQYTYAPIPAVSSVSPNAGVAGGGNTVTVNGTLFTGVTQVSVGSVNIATACAGTPTAPCFAFISATQINIDDFPGGSGNVDITVTTPGGTSPTSAADVYAYAPMPTITKVSPNHGSINGGTSVTLTGTGFEPTGTNRNFTTMRVSVGAILVTITPCPGAPTAPCYNVNSSTQIFVEDFPPHAAGPVDITVTTIGGTSATSSADKYIYGAVFPTVTSLSESAGAEGGGALLTISGANYLSASITVSDIFFGSIDVPAANAFPCPATTTGCFTVIGPNQINADTPETSVAGAVDISVQTNIGTSGTSAADQYTYVAPGAYSALTPFRICDTRPTGTHVGCTSGRTLGANGAVVVQITGVVVSGESVPAGAQAVVVNLTAIDHSTANSFVTAYPSARPVASNINVAGGQVQANLAVVALSSTGTITVFNAVGSVDVLVDIEGYFVTPSGSGAGTFHPLSPVRVCNTRALPTATNCTTGTLPGGTWRKVTLSGLPPGGTGVGIPSNATAAAAVFNLTAVIPSAATFLAVTPPTSSDLCPTKNATSSNLNPAAGESEPNRVISTLGPEQDICVFNSVGNVNFIIDVNGWFGSGAETPLGADFYAVPPTRICDTRAGSGTQCTSTPTAGSTRLIPVAGIKVTPAIGGAVAPVAVVGNLTGISGSANTFLELYPADAPGVPKSSDLNPAAHAVIANLDFVSLATSGLNNGKVDLFNSVGTINIILDVSGWFQ